MAASTYYLIDSYTGANGGGGSGARLSPDFTSPTLAKATQVAYLFASTFQRPVRLVDKNGTPPWTLVSGEAPNVALTSCPSGTAY